MSSGMPILLVTSHMCSAPCRGMSTPALRPSCLDHIPAAHTTTSHSMSPRSVDTPVTAPVFCATPVTCTFSTIRAPPISAPRATDIAALAGIAWPSSGMYIPPLRSSVRMSGHIVPASSAGDLVNLNPVAPAQRQDALELVHAVVRRRDGHAARRAKSRRNTRLLVQRGIELDAPRG